VSSCLRRAKEYKERRFFHTRAITIRRTSKLRGVYCPHSAPQLMIGLATKWKTQKGFCALSGIKLTRDNAEVDHIIPVGRGGQSILDNLRWLSKEANWAKRDLIDSEFFDLIKKVVVRHSLL